MKCLGGDYDVEPGEGIKRNVYLRDHDIKTYLIKTGLNRTVVNIISYRRYILWTLPLALLISLPQF